MLIATTALCEDGQAILEKSCAVFSENWQGLRYHYPGGKSPFLKKCMAGVRGKKLSDGLWAIRSMMPDGHADFQIIDNKAPARLHPLVLDYNPVSKTLRVEAALDGGLKEYVGRRIMEINGKPFMEALLERAVLEPQSTFAGSLEVAARTLTSTLSEKPYPDFPEKVDLVFEDGATLTMTAKDLDPLHDANRYVLSANGYPSLWGGADVSEENGFCISQNEIAKTVLFDGKKWLWWHPRALNFKKGEIREAFACWAREIRGANGVVLDLRDTAGGGLWQIATMAYQFQQKIPAKMRSLVSDGEMALAIVKKDGDHLGPKTPEGYLREVEISTPKSARTVTPWKGRLVVITNGLCGSACDMIAYFLRSRQNTCSYGLPTAGRLIGNEDMHPAPPEAGIHVDLGVPIKEYLQPNGDRWEGVPVVPDHLGSGGINEAFTRCKSSWQIGGG